VTMKGPKIQTSKNWYRGFGRYIKIKNRNALKEGYKRGKSGSAPKDQERETVNNNGRKREE